MPKTSTPTLTEPEIEMRAAPAGSKWPRVMQVVEVGLLLVAAIFFALHFVHLKADFPNYSPWMDWAKYTDEGWYGDAAIRLYQWGHWNVPGDFNPGAALPVWPALEVVLFRFTGVSLVAARVLSVSVFGLTLVGCYGLLRMWMGRSLAPSICVALLAVSPFCFAFTRLAIVEPLLVLWMVVALLVASMAGRQSGQYPVGWVVALGLLFALMVLTKTTALFLFPAVMWMLWATTGDRMREFLRAALGAAAVGMMGWGAYFELLVRPHYLVDYNYLFDANSYTGFKLASLGTLLFKTVLGGVWLGGALFAVALVAIVGTIVGLIAKGPRANPVAMTMLLWVLGYGAFLAYHANLQPRYYLVLAVPLTVLAVVIFEPLLMSALRTRPATDSSMDALLVRMAAGFAGALLVFAGVSAARQTLGYVLHPEYSWVSAAARIHEAVEREAAAHPEHSKLVLSISGSNLSLTTGLRSICDDFGTMSLPERIVTYKPGWFATWNEVEDDKMEALAPMYRLERVLAVPAFDDPDRNLLILYRLDALESPGEMPKIGRRLATGVRKSVRTKIGQQPSETQLKH